MSARVSPLWPECVVQIRLAAAPVVDPEMLAMTTWYRLATSNGRLRDLEDECRRLAVPSCDAAFDRNRRIIRARLAALVEGADLEDCQLYFSLVFDREGRARK